LASTVSRFPQFQSILENKPLARWLLHHRFLPGWYQAVVCGRVTPRRRIGRIGDALQGSSAEKCLALANDLHRINRRPGNGRHRAEVVGENAVSDCVKWPASASTEGMATDSACGRPVKANVAMPSGFTSIANTVELVVTVVAGNDGLKSLAFRLR